MSFARRAAAARSVVFPGRYLALFRLLLAFIALNAAVRAAVVLWSADPSLVKPRLIAAFLIGLVFDIGVAAYFLAPLALVVALWPSRRGRGLPVTMAILLLPLIGLAAFTAASEVTFWNEFTSRFNFIAVDYLIYTHEVIGNIRESYNLPLLFGILGVVVLLAWAAVMRWIWPTLAGPGGLARQRLALLAIWLAAPFLSYVGLDARYKDFSHDAIVNEVAGNGYFDIWHAFWANEIDYDRFYRTVPEQQALRRLAIELSLRPVEEVSQRPYDRQIVGAGPAKRLNVVMVTIESFSAEFMTAFGNKQNLTPNMDQMAREGLLFTRLYATGTRTVRGLEAVALSIPPTPGNSIVKRPDNADLFTVGKVFRTLDYEALYLYGGYAYFDNMATFFRGNGYTVIDRSALAAKDIHAENIWGVADEDLFALAIRELDKRWETGKKFYAHIMTTSNHRPYTYPEGRIDIPSKTGREGAVKYTDWAIGQFIADARKRPWFDDTVFIFLADHTHKGRGRTELPIENYHIPMVIYAPRHIGPAVVDTIASQIDVSPTLLGLLNVSYRSRFFGQDILREGRDHQRALIANYQTVGYYEDGRVVELKPNRRARVLNAASGRVEPDDDLSRRLIDEAISYYQVASGAYRRGDLKLARH
ncbi:MAG: LTA synthase family protein [Alphaproteobacteria bacterium]|nr:LTA synthase family protein [Alphaproteobacteria bacterium]